MKQKLLNNYLIAIPVGVSIAVVSAVVSLATFKWWRRKI